MQFKHPEILWALFLLLIPIIIHLFQLRKFKKTPFTNVAMLQKVVSESRKSNSLKKWLLLATRLLLLACIILAFAQPFFAKKAALQEKEMVIYLDNSFSMQAKKDGFTLLETAVQDLVKSIPPKSKFSLFTNTKTFKDATLESVQNDLLGIPNQAKQLTYDQILLKSRTLFSDTGNTQKNLIFISDFQQQVGAIVLDSLQKTLLNLVRLKPESTVNISIDSVYQVNSTSDQIEMGVVISGLTAGQSVPISIFNNNKLIAKTAIEYSANGKATTSVSLQKGKAIDGRISLSDNGLTYDNDFYFTIEKRNKINVLAISDDDAGFLNRIYTDDEFNFRNYGLKDLDFSQIDTQNLIVLNGLTTLPTGLQTILKTFYENGGSLVIVPGETIDLNSYNLFLSNVTSLKFNEKINQEQKVSKIAFTHPIMANVFEKQVSNFEYPMVKSYWNVSGNNARILSFDSNMPFLMGSTNLFVFTAALTNENSNFKNAPLIVPTFYKMGLNSLKTSNLYATIHSNPTLDIAHKVEKDNVIKVTKPGVEFIPLQRAYSNKVSIDFTDNPFEDGIYSLVAASDTLSKVAFNYNRKESLLNYQDLNTIGATIQYGIPNMFASLAVDNTIDHYWKWFVIFALVFAFVEVLIQKFLA